MHSVAGPIIVRPARAAEAGALSRLALRSKAHWGYDAQFLEACRPALTLSPGEVVDRRAVVAEESHRIVGFYTLEGTPPEGRIGHLWIEPTRIGYGVGRLLWEHAMSAARAAGFGAVLIDADPHAEGFYLAMGADRVGETRSEVLPGRMLPRLRMSLF